MRWIAIAVALLALVLVGAGCGGDDETASDTTTLTETTTDDTTTDATTELTFTEETTTDGDSEDAGSLASGECRELVEAGTQLSQAFGSGTSSANFDDLTKFYDEIVAKAPEEIRADVQVLADAWGEYAEVLADVDVEAGQTPDPEALAKLQQALVSIDQQEVSAAAQRISTWTTANCQSS